MKFRAKRKYGNEIITGYHNVIDGKHYIFNGDNLNSPDWFEIDPTTLAMSTGQPDKNGVEIFGSVPVEGGISKGGDICSCDLTHASWWFYSDARPTGRDGYASVDGVISIYYSDAQWKVKILEIKKDFWHVTYPTLDKELRSRVETFKNPSIGRITITGKQYELFKPCGEGDNICNCKNADECGYL